MPAPSPLSFTSRDHEPAGTAPPAIELQDVGHAFGDRVALAGVTLTVRPGERVALLGPSGAGKSTLLRIVNTSLPAARGDVRVLGAEVKALAAGALRELRARIGTVHQQLQLVAQASVLENVLMGRLGRRSALGVALAALRRRDRAEVAAVLDRVGLAGRLDDRVDRLSGGEQQRVAVARVLYQAPELVVADEPFASVDPERSREVVALLLQAARGRALVLSTHHLEPVLPHFPRLVGLRGGRVLFDRRREDVTSHDLALLYQPEAATRSRAAVPLPAPASAGRAAPAAAAAPAELRLGASTTPGESVLPAAVAEFARARPAVQVRLSVKGTGDVLRELQDGTVELAFVGGRTADPAIHFEDFADDEIVLLAAPGFGGLPDPLPATAVTRLPRVDREPGSATRAIAEAQLAEMGLALDPAASVLQAGSVASLIAAVSAGMGVGFASRRSVAEALAAGRVREVRIEDVQIPRRFFVAWRAGTTLSTPAREFLQAARRAAGARSG